MKQVHVKKKWFVNFDWVPTQGERRADVDKFRIVYLGKDKINLEPKRVDIFGRCKYPCLGKSCLGVRVLGLQRPPDLHTSSYCKLIY
jgi:hypothetical protein